MAISVRSTAFFRTASSMAGISVVAGDLIIVGLYGLAGTASVNDTINSYTPIISNWASQGFYVTLAYAWATTTASLTIGTSNSTGLFGGIVHVVSGLTPSIAPEVYTNKDLSPVSVTTTNPNDYLFAFLVTRSNNDGKGGYYNDVLTYGGGFTKAANSEAAGDTNDFIDSSAYKIVSSSGTQTLSWTTFAGVLYGAILVAFKASGGAPAYNPSLMLSLL